MASMAIALGSLVGTGIQATYAWMGYNRDQFALNVGWRQAQKYQEKNYQISWVSIARDDIHQMMDVAVSHAHSYVGISTMALSATVLAFATASFSEKCPTFVIFEFYTCGCTAFIFLLLSIMLGTKAQHSAHENTCKILTECVRPSNPTGDKHNFMSQAEQFEKLGMSSLFRMPGASTNYAGDHPNNGKNKSKQGKSLQCASPPEQRNQSKHDFYMPKSPKSKSLGVDGLEAIELEGLALEEQDRNQAAQYLRCFHSLTDLWMPYVQYSKLTMIMGIVCDIQAFSYFAGGKVRTYADDGAIFLAGSLVVSCIAILMIISDHIEHYGTRMAGFAVILLMSAGPVLAVVGEFSNGIAEAILAILSFFFHFLFWAFAAGFFIRGVEQGISQHNDGKHQKELANVVATKETDQRKNANADHLTDLESGRSFWDEATFEDFKSRGSRKRERTLRAMKSSTATAAVLWFGMLAWVTNHYWSVLLNEASQDNVGKLEELSVKWPSTAFRPRHIACSGETVVVSDGLRVFEIFPFQGAAQEAQEVQCGQSSQRIADLSLMCTDDGKNCKPMALMKGDSNMAASTIRTCSKNGMPQDESSVSSVPENAKLIEVIGGNSSTAKNMLVATQEDLVEYSGLTDAGRWVPQRLYWDVPLRDQSVGTVQALGSLSDVLVLFRSKEDTKSGHTSVEVESRLLNDMAVQSSWHLPSLPQNGFAGACAVDSSAALLLVNGQLFKATLQD